MDNNVTVEVRKIDHISYSFLHLWSCPYASFLRYEGGLRGKTTPWLALGNALHTALESAYDKGTLFELSKALRLFKGEYNRIIDEEEVSVSYPMLKKLEAEGIEMLGLYNAQIQAGTITQKPMVVEKEFKLRFNDEISIVGRIDKIEEDESDGELAVIDYKSGKAKPDLWFLSHDLQFTTYAWACLEIYGRLPKKVVWHHLRTGELLETTRTLEDINDLKRMIQNVIDMREQGIRYRIFHDKICGQCDFRGAVCEDRVLEAKIVEGVARLAAN